MRELSKRNLTPSRRRDKNAVKLGKIFPQSTRVTHVDRVSLAPFYGGGDVLAADCCLDNVVYVSHAQTVASRFSTVDFKVHVVATGDSFEKRAARSGNTLKDLLQLNSHFFDGFEFGAKHFNAHRGAYAGGDHVDSRADGKKPCIGE